MRAHQQQAARRRPMCQVRVREREYVVREHERVVALARGDREGSFVRRRAELGHSIVDRSTRYTHTSIVAISCVTPFLLYTVNVLSERNIVFVAAAERACTVRRH